MKSANQLPDSVDVVDPDITTLRQITTDQLLNLGKRQIAYLKMGFHDGTPIFIIFGADGAPVMAVDSVDQAAEAVTQLSLDLTAVH